MFDIVFSLYRNKAKYNMEFVIKIKWVFKKQLNEGIDKLGKKFLNLEP